MSEADPYLSEAASSRSQAEQERQAVMLVATLGLTPSQDGDKWCFLWGENIQEGVAGFGDTVMKAIYDFNSNVYHQKINPVPKPTCRKRGESQ